MICYYNQSYTKMNFNGTHKTSGYYMVILAKVTRCAVIN